MSYTIAEPRPIPSWVKGQLPTQAMADLLRRQKLQLAAAQSQTAAAQREACDLAEAVGLALWKKRASADPAQFRTLHDALAASGVELIDHVGQPVAGELEEMADIIDWVDAGQGVAPGMVAEAFEPEIRFNGRLAHRARLVGVLDDDSEPVAVGGLAEPSHGEPKTADLDPSSAGAGSTDSARTDLGTTEIGTTEISTTEIDAIDQADPVIEPDPTSTPGEIPARSEVPERDASAPTAATVRRTPPVRRNLSRRERQNRNRRDR